VSCQYRRLGGGRLVRIDRFLNQCRRITGDSGGNALYKVSDCAQHWRREWATL